MVKVTIYVEHHNKLTILRDKLDIKFENNGNKRAQRALDSSPSQDQGRPGIFFRKDHTRNIATNL